MIKHTEDFKREAVRIALTSGLSRERIAADLGVGKSTLGKWIFHYRPTDLVTEPQADLARENERLRLENRILKEERDILKKATQFFASLCGHPLGQAFLLIFLNPAGCSHMSGLSDDRPNGRGP